MDQGRATPSLIGFNLQKGPVPSTPSANDQTDSVTLPEHPRALHGYYCAPWPWPSFGSCPSHLAHCVCLTSLAHRALPQLRPGVRKFLADASELFMVSINTLGSRHYAHMMAGLLDSEVRRNAPMPACSTQR